MSANADAEMARIHDLYQGTKSELAQRTQQEVQRHHAHERALSQMQALQLELRDKLRFTELQLAGAREEGASLAATVEELRGRLGEAQSLASEQRERQRQQEPRVSELQAMVERLTAEKSELQASLGAQQRRVDGLAQTKESTIQLQEAKLREVREELDHSRSSRHGDAQALEAAHARAAELERSNAELSRQLLASKEQLRAAHHARRGDAHREEALAQLQSDNARLVKILATTEEYKEFVHYADDSGGLSYVPPPARQPLASARAATGRANGGGFGGGLSHSASFAATPFSTRPATPTGSRAGGLRRPASAATLETPAAATAGRAAARADRADRVVRGAAREVEHWVPADAHSLAHEWRRQYAPDTTADSFSELLLRLNRVWKAREGARLERQREKLGQRIGELKRQLSHGAPYEQVMHGSELERLKRELRDVRATLNTGRRRLNDGEERLLENSLASADALNAQLMHTKAEADELRRELADADAHQHAALGRGAAAAVERAVGLSDTLIERVRELIRDFQGKTVALSRTDADYFMKLLRLQAWFLENLERRLGVGREKMLGVYEDVLQSHAPPARAAAAARSPAQTHLAAALRTGSGIASPYRGGRSYPDSEEEI